MKNERIKEQGCRMEGYNSRYGEWEVKRVEMKNGRIKEERWRIEG